MLRDMMTGIMGINSGVLQFLTKFLTSSPNLQWRFLYNVCKS